MEIRVAGQVTNLPEQRAERVLTGRVVRTGYSAELGQVLLKCPKLLLPLLQCDVNVATLSRDLALTIQLSDALGALSHLLEVWHQEEAAGSRKPVLSGEPELPGIKHHLTHLKAYFTSPPNVKRSL